MSESEETQPTDAAKLMRGPRAHSVAWTIYDDSIEGVVTCHAAVGADCRLDCANGCAEWDSVDHEHELVDSGRCLVVEWIENVGVQDSHNGTHALVDGFIDVEYGDGYAWSYSEAAAALRQPREGAGADVDELAKADRWSEPHEFAPSPENEFCGWCAGPEDAECHSAAAEAADKIEWLEAQRAALLAEVREWMCDACNTVYPGPPQEGVRCVICPKCGGKTAPRTTIEKIRLLAKLAEAEAALAESRGEASRLREALWRIAEANHGSTGDFAREALEAPHEST